jgi:YHS domain-containing protein
VAFLARIIRFLMWLVVLSWATWLLRRLFTALSSRPRREVSPAPPMPKPLYRDPWCGTHVSGEISYTLEQAGQVLHFCSAECRDRYRASLRRAAGR